MGAWSARHRRLAIGGWFLFVIALFVVGSAVPRAELTNAEQLTGDAAAAQALLDEHGFETPATEMVLVQRAGDVPQVAATTAVRDLVDTLRGTPDVTNVADPLGADGGALLSADGRSMLVPFEIVGDAEQAADKVEPIIDAVQQVAAAHPDVRVEQFGGTSAGLALDAALDSDMKRAEYLSLPITLAVLLLAFGALVAAFLPLGLALTAFLAALGLLSFGSHVFHVTDVAQIVMLLIGLAVGVDYSLFYLKREREERLRGASPEQALAIAAATSGRSVLISGITVVVAMSGLFLTGHAVFNGVGMATILVVLTSMLASLTVLPALMSWLADRINKGRVPWVHKLHSGSHSAGFWGAVLDRVLRRPVLALIVSGGLLVGLALPALSIELRNEGIEDLPQDLPVMQTYNRLNQAFPGGPSPAEVAVEADDVTSPAVQAALADLRERALATRQMNEPITVALSEDDELAVVSIPLDGDGQNRASVEAFETLRDTVVPAAFDDVDGVTARVGGEIASAEAFKDLMRERTPYVFGFVLLLAFALLLVSFRSIVVAVKAIALNLLSVAAAYGALVLVFQHGYGGELVGVHHTTDIINWLPLFLFVILFGLSMDYHVFILSRIREGYDRGLSTRDAISEGIRSTAGVVTSAATIMVFVFLCFVPLSLISLKQVGLGLAIAVLLDATIVRAVLLPAAMQLLGDRNWYLPRWLEWLPSLDHGEHTAPLAPAAPAPTTVAAEEPTGDRVPTAVH
jgi:RND superfamily putative drug exporter